MINHNKFLQIFTTSLLVGSTLLTSIPVNAEVAEEVPTSSAKETTTNKSSTDDFAESTSTQQSTDIPTYDSSNNEAESVVADRIDTSSSDQITLKNSDDTPASSDSNKEQKATMRRAAAEDESISSWMPDSALQQAVSKKLNIPIEQLTKEDLVGLHSLTVSGVTSLKGLEYASEIIQLSAINGSITDLSPLSGLLNLEVLSLNANNINDLSIISTLSGLETLSFSNNPISKLPDFSQNSNLTGITGSNCFITDLTPLGTLPKHAVVTFQNQHIDPINLMIDKGSSEVKTSGVIKKIDGSWANPASLAPATTSKWDGTNFIFSGPGDYSASYRVPGNSMISLDYNSSIQFHVDQLLENIKVEYLNEEDNLPIHDPVMISGLFGESYDATTSQYKLEINGFTLDEAKLPSNATGTITKMDKIVKYYYKKDLTSVSVHDSTIYVGDEWKAEDNFDSALNKDGEAVEFKDITVDDSQKDTSKAGTFDVTYTYDGVTSTATITVKEKNISNEKSTVVVQYVDENGNKISNDTILTGNNGEKYQTKAKKIKGYTLSKTPENSEGEFSDKEISVTYIYKKEDDGEINIINQKDTNSHTGASSKQNQSVFPKTGEKSSTLITITGTALLFLISSLFLIKRKNRRDN